jgi:hypothetical protein
MTIAKTRRIDSRRTEIVRFGNEGMLGRVPGEKGSLGKIIEPATVDGKQVRDGGYQLRQLDELLRAHDLVTRLVLVDDKKSEEEVRADLRAGD